MTLEEAEKRLTSEQRTIINTVGENEIVVKKRLSDTAKKLYSVYYAIKPKEPSGFNGSFLGEYSDLEEVRNHFIDLSFASDIDQHGWAISPEKG